MKSKFVKLFAAAALLATSAVAFASSGCCGDLECCMRMLACCFQ